MYCNRSLYGHAELTYEDLLECDRKNRMELEYYKLRNTKDNYRVKENSDTYGIEIIKKEYNDENEFTIEKGEIHNLTKSEKFADNILNIIKNNKVTPMALDDVICDLLKTQLIVQ